MVEFFAGIACGVIAVWLLRLLVHKSEPQVYIREEAPEVKPPKSLREYLEEKIK